MTLCRDCRWWDQAGSVTSCPEGMGSCEVVRSPKYYGQDKAMTAFGYDLFTRPDFGCILGIPIPPRETK